MRRSNGLTGSTIVACSNQSATCHQLNSNRSTIDRTTVRHLPPDLNPESSGEAGAVHNLTDQQKEKLQAALAEKREKVVEFLKTNPAKTKAEIVAKVKEQRAEIHERIAAFLSPEQLSKWDSEVAKAKEFLGQRLDS